METAGVGDLSGKVKIALDETRMLAMGVQILLGFEYNAVLMSGFDKLPEGSQYLKLVSHSLLLIVFALLTLPTARHQLADRAMLSESLVQFVTKIAGITLLPFAVALGIDIYVATERIGGQVVAVFAGALACLLALVF